MMMRCRIGCLFVHHMNIMYDVLTLTSTCLMSREVLSKSLSTIKSACLEVEGAKPAWHALAVTLQSFSWTSDLSGSSQVRIYSGSCSNPQGPTDPSQETLLSCDATHV